MRKFLAVTLVIASVFYTFPVRAAEPVRHYFTLNVRPLDPNRKADWNKSCILRLMYDEKVEISFGGGGNEPGQGSVGDLRRGTPLIISKTDGTLEWIYNCGNDLIRGWDRATNAWMLPKDWRPEGYLDCPVPADEKRAAVAPIDFSKPIEPITVSDYNREFHLGLTPEDLGLKKLELAIIIVERDAKVPFGGGKKNNALVYVGIGAAVIAILVIALGSGGGGNKGPSPDPPNGSPSNPANIVIHL